MPSVTPVIKETGATDEVPKVRCWAFRLCEEAKETLRPEGVDCRPRAARRPLFLTTLSEDLLGPLDVTSTPGGRQLRRAKARVGACTQRLPHSFPLLGAGIMGVGPKRLSERNHTLFLCFRLRRRCLFSHWAAQAGSIQAISSAVPHAVSTKGRSQGRLKSGMSVGLATHKWAKTASWSFSQRWAQGW